MTLPGDDLYNLYGFQVNLVEMWLIPSFKTSGYFNAD